MRETFTNSLHVTQIWGLPCKIFVCVMDHVVAMLSITGGESVAEKEPRRAASMTVKVTRTVRPLNIKDQRIWNGFA